MACELQAIDKVVAEGEKEREEFREDADRELERLKCETRVRPLQWLLYLEFAAHRMSM